MRLYYVCSGSQATENLCAKLSQDGSGGTEKQFHLHGGRAKTYGRLVEGANKTARDKDCYQKHETRVQLGRLTPNDRATVSRNLCRTIHWRMVDWTRTTLLRL